MPGELTLLAIALLPLMAGLLVAGFAPKWRRWFGAERALMVAFRIALGGTLLAALLLGTAASTLARRPELSAAQPVAWARVGHTTMLGLDVELDALALVVAGLALVVALAVQIAALGDLRGGARALGRSGLALGGALLLALSATAWAAALGWQILALVAGACGEGEGADGRVASERSQGEGPEGQVVSDRSQGEGPEGQVVSDRSQGEGPEGQVVSDRSQGEGPEGQVVAEPGRGARPEREARPRRWARVGDAGVWLALLMMALGVGELGLGALERASLLAGRSRLVVAELGGVSLATVAALGLVLAVLARARGLPAALRGEGPVVRAVLHGLVAGAGVLLLLRLHLLLTMAPEVMAGLAVVGAGLALAAGVAGLRARGVAATLGRVTQAQLGLMLTAVGLGAWVPACGLLLAQGLASGALALAPEGRAGRASRWLAGLALAGVLPLGAALWSGELLGASAVYLSAWSPGLNLVVTGLATLATLAVAGAIGQVVVDRSPTGGGPERALAAVGLGLAAVFVGAIDLPGASDALRMRLGPVFGPSWLLPGEFALGPRPPFTVGDARWGLLAGLLLGSLGFALRSRLVAWASRLPTITWPSGQVLARRGRALVRALHELGEQKLLPRLFLAPFSVRAARAPGPEHPQRGLLLGLLGALALLGFVYCNPDVAQVGPSRVYPVDLGGLDPALLGSGRSREPTPAPAVTREVTP